MVPSDERSSENCLHCEINDLVQEHVEGQEKVGLDYGVSFFESMRGDQRIGMSAPLALQCIP
jgi:hypothetical protein